MPNKKNKNEVDDDIVIDDNQSRVIDDTIDVELVDEEAHAESKVVKIKKELERCRAEKQEYLNGWQRAKADYVNVLKRSDKEKASIQDRVIEKTVTEFLPALDSLLRASDSGDIPKGFDAIAKQLINAFSSLNVKEVPAEVGEAFDPVIHEAFGQDETDDPEKDDTISLVLEKGWQIGDNVIRPAKVRVAKHV
ncbi:hypothetical protein MNBD_CPR01-418 [hydrothermal vent metagenome]|uniref:Heat shock protein GrpE n=1 Tax=hydrothermal vent metagenome TaxID=652676 RepID=A0A3B0VJC1_9ZZZZ